MKAIFVESSLPNVSKNFVLKNIGILSDKYMSLIRETLKYCLADLFRKWGEGLSPYSLTNFSGEKW